MSNQFAAIPELPQLADGGELSGQPRLAVTPQVTPARPAPPPPAAALGHPFVAQSASSADHYTGLGPSANYFSEQPCPPLKPKDFSHLILSQPATTFPWWLCNLRNAVVASHPGFTIIFDPPAQPTPTAAPFEQSFAKLLYHLVREDSAYITVMDAMSQHPSTPGSSAIAALRAIYQPIDRVSQLKKLLHAPMEDSDTFITYVAKLRKVRTELRAFGHDLPDSDLIDALKNGLNIEPFRMQHYALAMQPPLTFDAAVSTCLLTVSPETRAGVSRVGSAAFYGAHSAAASSGARPVTPAAPSGPSYPTAEDIANAVVKAFQVTVLPELKRSSGGPGGSPSSGGRSGGPGGTRSHCDYCGRDGHRESACFRKMRDQGLPIPETLRDKYERIHPPGPSGARAAPATADAPASAPAAPRTVHFTQPAAAMLSTTAETPHASQSSTEVSRIFSFFAAQDRSASSPESDEEDLPDLVSFDSDDEDDFQPASASSTPTAHFSHSHSRLPQLPPVSDIPPDVDFFQDVATPIRLLSLCSGGSVQFIEEMAAFGRYFEDIYLCDKDPAARAGAHLELLRLVRLYPQNFGRSLKAAIRGGPTTFYTRVPMDITAFTEDDFETLRECNLILATPDCQPFSLAGRRLGFQDPRAVSFTASLEIIFRLSNYGSRALNYVIENVPGAASYYNILDALGVPIIVQAHLLGSYSRRDTLLWTNSRSLSHLREHYRQSQVPVQTVQSFLEDFQFAPEWSAPSSLKNRPFNKFVSRPGSHAFRMHGDVPGSSLLIRNGFYEAPSNDMRALSMGFLRKYLDHPELYSAAERHRLLGSVLDGNICRWLCRALHDPTPAAAVALAASVQPPSPWRLIYDTGASEHMWGDLAEFHSYSPFPNGPVWINGLSTYAFGTGDVYVRFPTMSPEQPSLVAHLRNVHYVPYLKEILHGSVRLFSHTRAQQQNPSLTLLLSPSANYFTVGNGLRVPLRPADSLLYIDALPVVFPSQTPAPSTAGSAVALAAHVRTAAVSRSLWHARLGHLNVPAVDHLARTKVIQVKGPSGPAPFCDSCALMKRTKAPISRNPLAKPDRPFRMVGLDFWENRRRSLQGNFYVFGAIDWHSDFIITMCLRSRADVLPCVRKLHALAASFGFSIECFRLDNDSVFHSEDFDSLCVELHIRKEFTAPYSQHQNGRIERAWGTLVRWTL